MSVFKGEEIRELKSAIGYLRSDIGENRTRYYELVGRIDRILRYLNVVEQVVNEVRIVQKGGPEEP